MPSQTMKFFEEKVQLAAETLDEMMKLEEAIEHFNKMKYKLEESIILANRAAVNGFVYEIVDNRKRKITQKVAELNVMENLWTLNAAEERCFSIKTIAKIKQHNLNTFYYY